MILRGDAGTAWFSSRGLTPTGSSEVVVDERALPGVRLTRTWHSPAAGLLEAPQNALLVVLQLDSSLEIQPWQESDGSSDAIDVSAGDSFAVEAGQRILMRSTTAGARIEIELQEEELSGLDGMAFPALLWRRQDQGWSHSALVSLINVVLNLDQDAPVTDSFQFVAAVRACWSAFLPHAVTPSKAVSGSAAHALARRALTSIETRALDPNFTVNRLAEELGVTRAYLWRVVKDETSTTPSDMLRAIRRRAAVAFTEESRKAGTRLTMDDLALKAGFGSVDSLRRALKTSDHDDPM
jgi:AraC-like DNA-binding protein